MSMKTLIDNHEFLLEGLSVEIVVHADTETILTVDIPQFVVMEVIYSEPGLRGDTATNTLKTGQSSEWRNNYGSFVCKYR